MRQNKSIEAIKHEKEFIKLYQPAENTRDFSHVDESASVENRPTYIEYKKNLNSFKYRLNNMRILKYIRGVFVCLKDMTDADTNVKE